MPRSVKKSTTKSTKKNTNAKHKSKPKTRKSKNVQSISNNNAYQPSSVSLDVDYSDSDVMPLDFLPPPNPNPINFNEQKFGQQSLASGNQTIADNKIPIKSNLIPQEQTFKTDHSNTFDDKIENVKSEYSTNFNNQMQTVKNENPNHAGSQMADSPSKDNTSESFDESNENESEAKPVDRKFSQQFLKMIQDDSTSSEDEDLIINNEDLKSSTTLGLDALTSLEQKAASISAEINVKLHLNKADPEIETLREFRRQLWNQIEVLEGEIRDKKVDTSVSLFSMSRLERGSGNDFSDDENQIVELFPEEKTSFVDHEILNQITEINKTVFHHQRFRGCQALAIEAALKRKDVFVLMPTGGGKSLVYQLAGYIEQKLTVIISPLISLIKDQVRGLTENKLPALAILGETTSDEYYEYLKKIKNDQILFLFITPEKLASSPHLLGFLIDLYDNNQITRFVIDEAHCVSQWGHDFRPAYTQLNIIKERFENVPIMALTATATTAVKRDIVTILNIPDCLIFQMSFNRPNLIYEVWEKSTGGLSYEQVLSFIHDHHYENKCGLIFCMSTSETEDLSAWLNTQGLNTRFYHAQMKDVQDRHKVQRLWMEGKVDIIVATLAFGMGIDKPDVRFVIHHTLPKSLEEYYQESGRAGRDGRRSHCLLLFSYSDIGRIKKLISIDQDKGVKKDPKRIEVEVQLLDKIAIYSTDRCNCRREMVLNYFSEQFDPKDCNETCDNCVHRVSGLSKYINVNVTYEAQILTTIIAKIIEKRDGEPPYPTPKYVVSLFQGKKNAKIREVGDDDLMEYATMEAMKNSTPNTQGHLLKYDENEVNRVLSKLIEQKIIKNKIQLQARGSIHYLAPGKRYQQCVERGFPDILIEREIACTPEGMDSQEITLYKKLLNVRRNIAIDRKCDPAIIISIALIKKMVTLKPKTLIEMLNVPGMTRNKVDFYGQFFIDKIQKWCAAREQQQKRIQAAMKPPIPAQPPAPNFLNRVNFQFPFFPQAPLMMPQPPLMMQQPVSPPKRK